MAGEVQSAKVAADAAKKSVDAAWQHFQHAANRLVQEMGDPHTTNHTDAFDDLKEACSEVTETSWDGYKKELKLKMTLAGATAEEIEEWMESKWKEVVDDAKKIRESKAVQDAAAKTAKVLHRIKMTLVGGLAAFMAFAFGYRQYDIRKHGDSKTGLELNMEAWKLEQEFQRQLEQQNALSSELAAPNLPDVPQGVDPTPIVQATLPPEVRAELPPAVAVVAIQPVTITLTTPTVKGPQTQKIESTVGQLWHHVPETRTEIERRAEEPQTKPYVYAFQQPGSCTQRKCMEGHGGIGGTWDGRKGQTDLHVESH